MVRLNQIKATQDTVQGEDKITFIPLDRLQPEDQALIKRRYPELFVKTSK